MYIEDNELCDLKPNNYSGETDLLTIEVPASYTEELLRHVQTHRRTKNDTTEDKIHKDIIKEAVNSKLKGGIKESVRVVRTRNGEEVIFCDIRRD